MESFVYTEMNKASRQKDVSMIRYYGPFASALGFIVHSGNKRQLEVKNKFKVYRGLKLSTEELENKYKIGNKIQLTGFTSSTLRRNLAQKFAFQKHKDDSKDLLLKPVLIEIDISGSKQFIGLNSSQLSAYP